ncbi:MAG TPA: DUF4138 domain-containing protein [Puia sp.]|nr:DUF4138 domain-containing protein [Puia sp.]
MACCGRKRLWAAAIGLILGLIGICWAVRVHAQEPGFHLEGMESRHLPVTGRKMTNVIFPVEIAAGVRVSRDVLVQKVKGVENVLELKALKRDFATTNLAVYGKDGRLYSFVLHYVEDTSVLDYRVVRDGDSGKADVRLSGWPVSLERLRLDGRQLAGRECVIHRKAVTDGLCLRLKGVYILDSLLWLAVDMKDRTAMGFAPGSLRIYTEDRKKIKRTATQEVDLDPVYSEPVGRVGGFERKATAVALHPFMVGRGKRLVIEVSDESGGRQVVLKVKGKVLLRATRE